MSSDIGLFYFMELYIYSDESGVFDYKHNNYFIFAGLICFGKVEKNIITRKYIHVENTLRQKPQYSKGVELKAARITNQEKSKIFRSLNQVFKFCVAIKQKEIEKKIFENKKHKQRYLDYAYKIVLKKCFEQMISKKLLNPNIIGKIIVNVDEHKTATDGKYELRENLLNEFKYGTFNFAWDTFFQPIFAKLKDVELNFCDSKTVTLIRAADIIANHCYHSALSNKGDVIPKSNLFIYNLPSNSITTYGFEYFENKKFN